MVIDRVFIPTVDCGESIEEIFQRIDILNRWHTNNYTVKYTMMRLFSNGCSFLGTRPKDGVDTFTTKILAEQYKMELCNLAMGGRGNDRISFTTKLWFQQNSTKDVFAVIGWSSTHRHDYLTNDGWKKGRIVNMDSTWRTWKTADNLRFISRQPGWDVDQQGEMRFLDHVLDLQNFFELKSIPYVMYNSLPNSMTSRNNDLRTAESSINKDRFFKFNTSHYDFIIGSKHIVSPNDPHPSYEGHILWTEQLKDFIDANDLRTIQ